MVKRCESGALLLFYKMIGHIDTLNLVTFITNAPSLTDFYHLQLLPSFLPFCFGLLFYFWKHLAFLDVSLLSCFSNAFSLFYSSLFIYVLSLFFACFLLFLSFGLLSIFLVTFLIFSDFLLVPIVDDK